MAGQVLLFIHLTCALQNHIKGSIQGINKSLSYFIFPIHFFLWAENILSYYEEVIVTVNIFLTSCS